MFRRAAVLSVAATLVLFGCVAMASVRGERSLAASKLEMSTTREDVDLDFVEEFDGDALDGGIGGSEVSDPRSAARAWDDAAPESQPVATTAADSEEETDPLAAWNDGAKRPDAVEERPRGRRAGRGRGDRGRDVRRGCRIRRQVRRRLVPIPDDGGGDAGGAAADSGATGSPRPSRWARSRRRTVPTRGPSCPEPEEAELLRFSPCASPEEAYAQWTTSRLRDDCVVDVDNCQYCVWVNMFDSEYRMNDVVSLRGDNYKLTSHSILMRPEFIGTILHRMLAQKPKGADGGIRWGKDEREEAKYNYNFVKDAVSKMECAAPEADTLLLHMRAGDYVNDAQKSSTSIDSAIDRMRAYVSRRPDIRKIEISAVLHFGMPDPDDDIYKDHPFQVLKSVDGEAVYAVNDDVLRKNGTRVCQDVRSRQAHRPERRVLVPRRPGRRHVQVRQGVPLHERDEDAGGGWRVGHGV